MLVSAGFIHVPIFIYCIYYPYYVLVLKKKIQPFLLAFLVPSQAFHFLQYISTQTKTQVASPLMESLLKRLRHVDWEWSTNDQASLGASFPCFRMNSDWLTIHETRILTQKKNILEGSSKAFFKLLFSFWRWIHFVLIN
jgi:hypothetical protein